MSFTDTFAQLDVEFPVPNNLDIELYCCWFCVDLAPRYNLLAMFFFFGGGEG